jgi:tetratricopeptide (TPR) repeat protein
MGKKPKPVDVSQANPAPVTPAASSRTATTRRRQQPPGRGLLLKLLAVVVVVAAAAGVYFGYGQYQAIRVARMVRRAFAERRFDAGRELLKRWLANDPGSGEPYYYAAWGALAVDQPGEAFQAIDRARKLGFDQSLVGCLSAIGQSRSGRFSEAEPVLEQAFAAHLEPKDLVAKELARIYLSTYRLEQAARAIEQWRVLAPEDAQPYMWSNEILSRSDVEPAIPIQNYRAALERDPTLDKARLGLAQQLSKARRFDEAEQEYQAYLQHKPNDAMALLGLGRNAFQQGGIDSARQYFEAALKSDQRQPDALKELSQIDVRLGRYTEACTSLERLIKIDPFDHEVRYSYAQALKLAGDVEKSNRELAHAARLRQEHEEIVRLRSGLVQDPNNVDVRFQVTKWMFDHGHQDEGLKWSREILRADPRHVPVHRLLADYYSKQGDAGLANYHRVMASAGQDVRDLSNAGVK